MNTIERIEQNADSDKGTRLSPKEARELVLDIAFNKAQANLLHEQVDALSEPTTPTTVLCPKCDCWKEPWNDDLWACVTCMPDRVDASRDTVIWKEAKPKIPTPKYHIKKPATDSENTLPPSCDGVALAIYPKILIN